MIAAVLSHGGRVPRISRALQVMVAVVLVLIFGVVGDQMLRLRARVVAESESQMARLDMVFAEQTGRAVETVDLLLREAIASARASANRPAPDAAAFDALLQRRITGARQVSEMLIADAQGHVLYSSRGAAARATLPPAGMTLLRHHADTPGDEPQISEPLHAPDGRWMTMLTHRINGADGGFEGIAVACLDLQYFEDFYKAVELSDNGAIVLHRRDGVVLARYPHSESAIGSSFAELPPFKEVLAHANAGTVLMTSPVDGSVRVLAIRALKLFPLAVNVSVDETRVLAPWRRETWTFLVAVLVACGVIGTLLLLLARESRRVERLVETAETANAQLRVEMDERERAQAALRQTQRIEAVGQLTGGVAHDFNNLLTVMLGNIGLLQQTVALDPAATKRLGRMRVAAERGATLTDQLLAFARRQPLEPRPVDIDAVLRGMTDLLQSAVGDNIVVEIGFADEPWPALVDPTQIELVILNLALNARDAMPGGGVLTVATGAARLGPPERSDDPPEGAYIVIRVSDTGSGMTPAVLAKVFEPFFTTKGPGLGSGLGLSQVFGVARQSGGGVQIESMPQVGTTVLVYLPRATEQVSPSVSLAPPTATTGQGTATILLVDDDEAVRSTTAMVLDSMGYVMREAGSGEEALEILARDDDIDVLLTDVAMPGMNGPELARRARALLVRLPVVFFSGYADPESVAGGTAGYRIVRKPFRASDLAAQIEAALAESRRLATSAG